MFATWPLSNWTALLDSGLRCQIVLHHLFYDTARLNRRHHPTKCTTHYHHTAKTPARLNKDMGNRLEQKLTTLKYLYVINFLQKCSLDFFVECGRFRSFFFTPHPLGAGRQRGWTFFFFFGTRNDDWVNNLPVVSYRQKSSQDGQEITRCKAIKNSDDRDTPEPPHPNGSGTTFDQ
jgi:hypothetical protein